MDLIVADIGGTHARFAIARIEDARCVALGDPVILNTPAYDGIAPAWAEVGRRLGQPLPRTASLAVAAPIGGTAIKLTNSAWVLRPDKLDAELGLDRHLLINDFVAVGHAVAMADPSHFQHVTGPDQPLPPAGAISIIGPGTGLGTALVLRGAGFGPAGYHVQPSEGGHMDFAALDAFEQRLRARFGADGQPVCIEKVVSGAGLAAIYRALAVDADQPDAAVDAKVVWAGALAGDDPLTRAALDRFCRSLGSMSGDVALVHGAQALVIAGGLAVRIGDLIKTSGFAERFAAKPPYEALMAGIIVKRITHPQPGLFGAAAAFAGWSAAGFA